MSNGTCLLALVASLGPVSLLSAGEPAGASSQPASLPADFLPLEEVLPRGRIDWTAGLLWIEGTSRVRGQDAQQRLMAERGAEVTARRNALAAALGIQLDPERLVGGYRSADIHIEGRVRGAVTTRVTFRGDTCTASACVPLWGIEGIGRLYWRPQQVRLTYGGEPRITLAARAGDGPRTNATVIINARERTVFPSLYAEVVDETGRRVHDLANLPLGLAAEAPPARFAWAADSAADLDGDGRIVVRALESSDRQLIISREDADRLARDPAAAGALRAGRVWVVFTPSEELPAEPN